MSISLRSSALIVAAAAGLALAACGRDEGRTAGQKLDAAIAKTEQAASEAGTSIKQGTAELKADAAAAMADAKKATADAASQTGQAIDRAAEKVSATASDVAITASVNAELAKDPSLSALSINVDTNAGKVLLRGTAPSAAARDRAGQIAKGVKGVAAVDNQLEVRA